MSPKIKYTEEELIAAIKTGDQVAFSHLYDNYSKAIYTIIFKIVRHEEEAEDVLQNVFVKIWSNFSAYDSNKGRLYTWMLNVARNMAIDYTRSKQAKMDGKIQKLENSVYNSSMQHQVSYDHIGVKEIVSGLKEEHEQLIRLAYFKGYTQEEMAEELKMPLGTVKTKIRSALMILRGLMIK